MLVGDTALVTGRVEFKLYGPDGKLKHELWVPNLVTTAGKGVIADRMKSAPAKAAMTHMAVGTSTTAAAVGDTALGAEVAASRTSLTSTSVSTNVITYVCTFGAGVGTGTLAEAGIFNAGVAGDMLCRTVYTAFAKGALDSLAVSWAVTIA